MSCKTAYPNTIILLICVVFLTLIGCKPSQPKKSLRLASIFSDHAVLQRGITLPIWGWDTPGKQITVHLADQKKTGIAGPGGKWLVKMDPLPAGGPHMLTVNGTGNEIRKDILIGEVWICSGQSNMEWSVANVINAEEEIASANFDRIRLLKVPRRTARTTQWDIDASWEICRPESIEDFSGVGYFFGRYLHKKLNVPIGLIHSNWGGTPAEAWTPKRDLAQSQTFVDRVEAMDRAIQQYAGLKGEHETVYQKLLAEYETQWAAYLEKVRTTELGTPGKWHEPEMDETDWKTAQLPGAWEDSYLPDFDGVVWYRRTVKIPEAWAGKDLIVSLGAIDDDDVTYFNGAEIGHIGYAGESKTWWSDRRVYTVPGELVKAGTNHLAVRVLDLNNKGGMVANLPEDMQLAPSETDASTQPIALAGEWKYKIGYQADAKLIPRPPSKQNKPGLSPGDPASLYNGMIAPLEPYGIAGTIWYQGEANAGRADEYTELLSTMIRSWRRNWGQINDFSFYIVQLANFRQVAQKPNQGGWAWIREAQAQVAQRVPGCGLAVAIDVGQADTIHPLNKQAVGKRLALQALKKTYGFDIVAAGPTYLSHRVVDDKVYIRFSNVGQGLVSRSDDGKISGFAITGNGKRWHWAEAKIEDDKVVVWSDKVANPTSVRYLWADNPGPIDLYNTANLPAGPFRTDTWLRTQH